MFGKEFKIKGKTPLKVSERKKLQAEILEAYPHLEVETIRSFIPLKEHFVYKCRASSFKNIHVNIYTLNEEPIFFKVDHSDLLYPTVFTLWKIESLVPVIVTHSAVWDRIVNGADLMAPGVISSSEWERKGTVVAVCLNDNPNPVAVGVTAQTFKEMTETKTGKSVEIVHYYTDHLWNLSPSKLPIPEIIIETEEIEVENDQNEMNKIDPDQNQMDVLMKYCLLKVIKFKPKTIVPILASNLYRNYIQQVIPANRQINLKESTYKKFSIFLKEMQNLNLVEIHEEKSVQSVKTFNYQHPDVVDFKLLPNDTVTELTPTSETKSTPEVVKSVDYYAVSMPTMKIFNPEGFSRGDLILQKDIQKYCANYVKYNNLSSKKKIQPDDYIMDLLKMKEVREITYPEFTAGVLSAMTAYHGTSIEKVVKGKSKAIQMSIQNRMGNKKVTIIDNLEQYEIDLKAFSKLAQQTVGASATIISNPQTKTNQIQLQGNQIHFMYKLLTEHYHVDKNKIKGLELAPKS